VAGRAWRADLSREIPNTRIQPGGRFPPDCSRRIDAGGVEVHGTVTVLPDESYTRFFTALVSAGAGEGEG